MNHSLDLASSYNELAIIGLMRSREIIYEEPRDILLSTNENLELPQAFNQRRHSAVPGLIKHSDHAS